MKCRNLIFDLGGVVIDLRRENAVAALERLGMENVDSLLGLYRQEEPFLSLETGEITAAEFFDTVRTLCKPQTSDTAIQEAFNSFLIGIPRERLEALRRLREQGFKVYGLSNTNAIMFNSWIRTAFMQEGLRVNDYFDGLVLSFEEGMCKPDKALFETVLRRYGLEAAETCLLDDSRKNCDAAEEIGLLSMQVGLTPDDDMLACIRKIELC